MRVPVVNTLTKKLFGTHNERLVKRYMRIVDQVNEYEPQIVGLTDAELRAKTDEFREQLTKGKKPQDIMHEVYAVAREVMDRNVGIRNIFNEQFGFDPSQLPEDARKLFEQTKQKIDSMEPAEPTGELLGSPGPVDPWLIVDIPNRLYEAVREVYPQSRPPFRSRPFDVQIIGALVLYEGKIAEMKTGEGKTIVAPLASYLAALEDKQVHVVTVNDYLVQRDRDWTFPFFRALGITVGAIHPQHMQSPAEKQAAYRCNVVYGTTSEFGFDYLRDNMKLSVQEQVQTHRNFAIVDEVDSTLIDEARTPLIISGQAHQQQPRYDLADRLARHLIKQQEPWNKADQKVQSCLVEISGLEGDIRNARDQSKVPALKERLEQARQRLPELEAERDQYTQFYEVEMDKKRATLTHEGITEAQKAAGIGSFYSGDNIDLPHLLEQSIRAHTVYQRDRDYVVQPDDEGQMSVIIVDQNTGRKMIGRQWSDGLHQAVEAKEGVPIKEETQTMATITIQNFFKLYDRLAGMTGTADTEATEFYEIYGLDVVVIPTNVPVIRNDHNDVVFISAKDKWDSIVDEIKRFHDIGRPVLVGTTSVEKSEKLSEMLKQKHGVEHEVLNAKHHEREAEIIAEAGELGAVMIATNMAGRGTDIRLGKFTPQQLIDHWKRRGICPKHVTPDMPEEQIVAAVYRHIAPKELDIRKNEVAEMSDEDIEMALLRHWAQQFTMLSEGKIESMDAEGLREALDATGSCLLHRLRLFKNVEEIGGLHVVGTERHEARRIDNQLRGRSGRQGDRGSTRFFLSLEDDLVKTFAGDKTLGVLSKLGMKEGDAIEHPMLSKAVTRAQSKVEERNFLIRKQILDYDEVMDHQRHEFYSMRQEILEGHNIRELIFEYIDQSVQDAVYTYLDERYPARCMSEWLRENLNITIDPDRLRGKDREDLHKVIRVDAKEEMAASIALIADEYMPEESEPEDWDLQSLSGWAKTNLDLNIKPSKLRDMSRQEVIQYLEDAGAERVDSIDLSPLDQYIVPHYGANELVKWAKNKFNADLDVNNYIKVDDLPAAADLVMQRAREAYDEREITYPIEFAIEMTAASMQQEPQTALQRFCDWVKAKYELQWTPEALPSNDPRKLREILIEEARKWDESRIAERAERAVAQSSGTPDELDQWFRTNCNTALTERQKQRAEDDPQMVAEEKIRELLRAELTQFERWVLLQIVDQAWKDHLYAMDQLRDAIGLRSFSQRDPRIEYKREGAARFEEMQQSIRDRVTDLIFKGRLQPAAARQQQQQPQQQDDAAQQPNQRQQAMAAQRAAAQGQARHPRPAQSAIAAAAAAAEQGTEAQQRDLAAAARAGQGDGQRKAEPVRSTKTVGRNEPCPCGSGKKYKQCCGKRA